MKKCILAALLALSVAGCSFDELVLTESEALDLQHHFQEAVYLYQDLLDFGFRLASGDADLTGYTYDPPTAGNNWVGTITYTGAALPTASGDFLMHFSVLGNGVPIDPQTFDFETATSIEFWSDVSFAGLSNENFVVDLQSDFTLEITLDGGAQESSILNGTFDIRHGDYVATLVADDFTLNFDSATQAASTASGVIHGSVDIPDYAFDANFSLQGVAEKLVADISVSGTHIHDEINLVDF